MFLPELKFYSSKKSIEFGDLSAKIDHSIWFNLQNDAIRDLNVNLSANYAFFKIKKTGKKMSLHKNVFSFEVLPQIISPFACISIKPVNDTDDRK